MACLFRNRIPAANSSKFKPDFPFKKAIRISCLHGVHPSDRRAVCGVSFATVQRPGTLDGDWFKGTACALSRPQAASALDADVAYPSQAGGQLLAAGLIRVTDTETFHAANPARPISNLILEGERCSGYTYVPVNYSMVTK